MNITMNTKSILLLIYIITTNLNPISINAQVLISDSFESMDLSATNSDGFSWAGTNRTSIVTQHPEDGNVVVFNGNPIYNIVNDDRDWTAFDGDYSLRFRYAAGAAMSEQRFDLGSAYPEIWISFWLRVPSNFSYGPTGSPNKFFALWSDGYENNGDGSTIWLGMHRYQGTGADLAVTYTLGGETGSLGYQQNTPFISVTDSGRWMQIIVRTQAESDSGASDGIIQTYRRWQGNQNFEQLHEVLNAPLKLPTSGPQGFKAGYLLGWANAAYEEDTEWLLDEFTVSKTSLLTIENFIFKDSFDNN